MSQREVDQTLREYKGCNEDCGVSECMKGEEMEGDGRSGMVWMLKFFTIYLQLIIFP